MDMDPKKVGAQLAVSILGGIVAWVWGGSAGWVIVGLLGGSVVGYFASNALL